MKPGEPIIECQKCGRFNNLGDVCLCARSGAHPRSILDRAEETVSGERAKDYGHPRENIERIRQRWSQVVGKELTSEQVCLMLVDLKVARLCNTPQHEDSWLDIAGYVRVNEMVKQ